MATEPIPPPIPAAAATPAVSVVVPVLNEAATVERLYQGITTTLDQAGLSHEIIFVDDGSRDGTYDTLARLHEADAARAGDLVQAERRAAPGDARRHEPCPRGT